MLILLMGAPGVGKGTQAANLVDGREHCVTLSTGEALRSQVREQSEVGKKVAGIMARGELVSDEILSEIIAAELSHYSDETLVILDGYPRNLQQVEDLQKLRGDHRFLGVVQIDVEREALLGRLTGRRVCSSCGRTYHVAYNPPPSDGKCVNCGSESIEQRPDDAPERVVNRLSVYEDSTRPVVDHYREKGQYSLVDGDEKTSVVHKRVEQAVDSLMNG